MVMMAAVSAAMSAATHFSVTICFLTSRGRWEGYLLCASWEIQPVITMRSGSQKNKSKEQRADWGAPYF
jgi:hypothetical protein